MAVGAFMRFRRTARVVKPAHLPRSEATIPEQRSPQRRAADPGHPVIGHTHRRAAASRTGRAMIKPASNNVAVVFTCQVLLRLGPIRSSQLASSQGKEHLSRLTTPAHLPGCNMRV
jgi:hypothetical protein